MFKSQPPPPTDIESSLASPRSVVEIHEAESDSQVSQQDEEGKRIS